MDRLPTDIDPTPSKEQDDEGNIEGVQKIPLPELDDTDQDPEMEGAGESVPLRK